MVNKYIDILLIDIKIKKSFNTDNNDYYNNILKELNNTVENSNYLVRLYKNLLNYFIQHNIELGDIYYSYEIYVKREYLTNHNSIVRERRMESYLESVTGDSVTEEIHDNKVSRDKTSLKYYKISQLSTLNKKTDINEDKSNKMEINSDLKLQTLYGGDPQSSCDSQSNQSGKLVSRPASGQVYTTYNNNNSTGLIHMLNNEIKNINYTMLLNNNIDVKSFYIAETIELLSNYKKILKTPKVVSFMGNITNDDKKKNNIIIKYLNIAKKYTNIENFLVSKIENNVSHKNKYGKNNRTNLKKTFQKKNKYSCKNCNCKKYELIDENLKICIKCGTQEKFINYTTSYKDVNRVNISSKYTYDRKIHFRDCINQYQGKQNSNIDQEIYTRIIDKLYKHHLLVDVDKTKIVNGVKVKLTNDEYIKKRFSKVTKSHILVFLKELGYTKHYENLNLIYFNITKKPIDDITHLETKLLEDFEKITKLYDKMFKYKIDRKNMVNTSFLLFTLLRRHKHPCKSKDFNLLKTIDRKAFHVEIVKKLFEELNWSFNPI